MILETERLILRPWQDTDAESLYKYAKDDRVGPAAGWPPHNSVEESADIIKNIFSHEGIFAVTLKDEYIAIGCIGLITGMDSNFHISDDEGEVSYWIGVPFWGKGFIPEAIHEIIRYGFENLKLNTLWCGYFDGNEQSKRAQEKCGFKYHRTDPEKHYDLIDEVRVQHVSRLTKEEWEKLSL